MNNYFNEEYTELIQEGVGGGFNNLVQKQLEKNLNKDFYEVVLELGALNGYHKQFRQHINYFTRINYLINDVFSDCRIIKTQMPIKGLWYHLNLATIYQIHA